MGEATQDTFQQEVLESKGTVLVDFYTDTCSPCRMMAPVLAELATERTDLKIVKVDAGVNLQIAAQFRVSAVPTFVLFRDGRPTGQFTGLRSKKDLIKWIESNR